MFDFHAVLLFLNAVFLRLNGKFCYIQVVTTGKNIGYGIRNVLREQAGCCIGSKVGIAVQVGLCHVRQQGSNLDAVFSCFVKKAVCKAELACLCGTIGAAVGVVLLCGNRREEDNMSAFSLFHKAKKLGGKENRGFQIGAKK